MIITDKMVDAALDAWHVHPAIRNREIADRRDMSAALTAGLAVSGYGEVVEALRLFVASEDDWNQRDGTFDDPLTDAYHAAKAALARVTSRQEMRS